MYAISLPHKPKHTPIDKWSAKFEIEGCYPGYGTTLGNALRRVLLSSLEGAAIVSVKIKSVSHEFSTIPGVMEDVVQIILNLKKVRFKMHGNEPVKLLLKAKGEGEVTAKSIKCPSSAEVVNEEQLIATITDKKMELEMELEINKGLGYVPVEQQVRENKEIGVIAIDAIYTPIKRVNYEVENMRVGKRTDYDKVTLEIMTDGSILPEEAFQKAIKILVAQFSELLEFEKEEASKEEAVEAASEEVKENDSEIKTEDPKDITLKGMHGLSTRTINVLEENKIHKIRQILKLSEEDLGKMEGMGEKGIKEIKKAIGEYGLTLK